jgi:hypothetical protein
MYKPGNLLSTCLEMLGRGTDPAPVVAMHVGKLGERDALRLSRFFAGVRVISNIDRNKPARVLKRFVNKGATQASFKYEEEGKPARQVTVAVRHSY